MAVDILNSKEARIKVAQGIKKLADSVRVTLGPKGRNVLIEQDFGAPLIINDGVTIAKNIELDDQFENLGASLLIEAASKTNDSAGDGTTTAIILAAEAILKGLEYIDQGINPVEIKEGFDYYLKKILDKLYSLSKSIDNLTDLSDVASLSSGSQEIGNLIADAYKEVGVTGEVSVEESRGLDTTLEIVKGYSYDRGYASSYMASNEEKKIAELENPHVLVTDKKINSMKELLPFLENSMQSGKPLLIVCDDIEQEVLSAIVMNKLRGVFNVVVTKAPSFGDRKLQLLSDIALITNATFISTTRGDELSTCELSVLGEAKKIVVSSNKTVIIDGVQEEEKIISYVEGLKQAMNNESSTYEKDKYKERIARLLGGVALIKVGAPTEVELKDKKLRIEDALCATKAALVSGTIEGGGKVFYELSNTLKDDSNYPVSRDILSTILKEPFYQIVKNTGCNISDIEPLINTHKWFDAKTKQLVDLREHGIIDPTSVEISAITNALSIAGIVLTTECAIIKKKEAKGGERDYE